MPPNPKEVEERAEAVRELLAYCRGHPTAMIGLAPEGMDMPEGKLSQPPPGAGRMIYQLANRKMPILPVGVFEERGELWVKIGPAYRLEVGERLAPEERDAQVSRTVMLAIAGQLPVRLRGEFPGEGA